MPTEKNAAFLPTQYSFKLDRQRVNFLTLTVSLSPHFSLMSLVILSMSILFWTSICTLPFLRVLSALMPTLISVGLTFDFKIPLIVSADLFSLEDTVSVWSVCLTFPLNASEYSFPWSVPALCCFAASTSDGAPTRPSVLVSLYIILYYIKLYHYIVS